MRRGLLLLVLALALVTAPPSRAQILPAPPTLPAPPEDGTAISDIVGPSVSNFCDTAVTAFALVGPIASAQLTPELQALVEELEPYIGTALLVCGFLVTPPTGNVCAADASIVNAFAPLGLPVNAPAAAAITYDTAAGIENAFLRVGIDLERQVSLQLAEALGCAPADPVELPPAAGVPTLPEFPTSPEPALPIAAPTIGAPTAFASAPSAAFPAPAAATRSQAAPVLTRPTAALPASPFSFKYPAAFLMPLFLLAGIAVFGRALTRPVESR